ncbi:MAG: carbohydrate-binding family 6 protein [Phycisphaerae bacterium]|nr:carbohydrate-binding family 6 protein [Phycisphaerae bacterium]
MKHIVSLTSTICVAVVLTIALACPAADRVVIAYRKGVPQADFAAGRIAKALERLKLKCVVVDLASSPKIADIAIIIGDDDSKLARSLLGKLTVNAGIKPQGFRISRGAGKTLCVLACDTAGAMYGGLDVAEQISFNVSPAKIPAKLSAPAIARRGIKFNIPLDARTPSYDDTGDAAQKNIVEMWNFEFWREFFDELAVCRYNTLTLWNPHPFPSIVKCPDYPDVALPNVCIPTIKPEYKSRSWREPQYVSPKVLANLKVVRKMTIDEKIAFWRRVLKHAADRGIDVYWITWNVMVNSAEGKYGLTTAQDNPKTIAYIRQCARQTVLTYPRLKGIGVTAGEGMRNRKDKYDREKWLWEAYGMGVVDAKAKQPDRKVRFIHRVWNSGMDRIMTDFASRYPDSFEVGFKYARARLYSSTKPPFVNGLLAEMKPHKVKGWWNLRNDDIFNFRWGDPDYVREFLKNLPPAELTAGYHMGSDGYVWGREHTSTEPEKPRQLEICKHWYNFMLWGRLGYDPKLDRAFFERVLASRLPQAPPRALYDAWQAASKIIPQVNRFHWRNWDFMWAVEICSDQRKGFHTVEDFIKCPTMEGSGLVSIRDYVERTGRKQDIEGVSPLKVADRLYAHATTAAKAVSTIRTKTLKPTRELRRTLADIEAMSLLGRYYASKIRGAVALQTFRAAKDEAQQKLSVKHLTVAAAHWKRYARIASGLYNPQLLARTRTTDWRAIQKDVDKDMDIARR